MRAHHLRGWSHGDDQPVADRHRGVEDEVELALLGSTAGAAAIAHARHALGADHVEVAHERTAAVTALIQTGVLTHQIGRAGEVVVVVDREQVSEGRRLSEQLKGQAVAGVVGVEQVTGKGEQTPPVLGADTSPTARYFSSHGPASGSANVAALGQ